jgi:hypothetical protein
MIRSLAKNGQVSSPMTNKPTGFGYTLTMSPMQDDPIQLTLLV